MNRRLPLAFVLAFVSGCAEAPVTPTPAGVVARPTPAKSRAAAADKGVAPLPDCCAPPSRSSLFVAAPKQTTAVAGQAPAAKAEQARDNPVVSDFLKPAATPAPWTLDQQRRKMPPPPAFLDHPESVFPPLKVEVSQPALERTPVVLLPRPLPEDAPLTGQATDRRVPEPIALPTKPLVKLPRVDPDRPVELPPLAKFQTDRVPATDVTAEVSLRAVLAKPLPVRETPEPFVRFFLPDPFEFRDVRIPPAAEEK